MLATPSKKGGHPRTLWRDDISDLAWSCRDVVRAELSWMAENRGNFKSPKAAGPVTLPTGKMGMKIILFMRSRHH